MIYYEPKNIKEEKRRMKNWNKNIPEPNFRTVIIVFRFFFEVKKSPNYNQVKFEQANDKGVMWDVW